MLKSLFVLTLMFISMSIFSQTQFWVDDFEGVNATSGTRTPENDGGVGGPPRTSYFCRTPATSTVSQAVAFTGFQGTNYWAGEDHDAAGTGFAGAGTSAMSVREQDITWTGISISSKIGLSLKCLLAANSTNQPFDNQNACSGGATTNTDYVILQYKIDAGSFNDLFRFFTKGSLTGKYLFLETTGDMCGDGTQLTNVFNEFSGNIIGTGTTLTLRLLVYSEGGNEEWGIDNIRLFYSTILPVVLTDFSGTKETASNTLYWTTSSELDNKYFEIQRSGSGRETDFLTIGSVKGNGSSPTGYTYSFKDNTVTGQTFYYRLKQVDLDGGFQYSKIIMLTGNRSDRLHVYPNPVTGRLTIDAENNVAIKDISLLDIAGRKLPVIYMRAGNSFNYDISGLAKGIYFVRVVTAEGILLRQISKL